MHCLQPVRLGEELDVIVAVRDGPGGNAVHVQLKAADIQLKSATGDIGLLLRKHSWQDVPSAGQGGRAERLLHLRVAVFKADGRGLLPFPHSQAALSQAATAHLRCPDGRNLALPLTFKVHPGV